MNRLAPALATLTIATFALGSPMAGVAAAQATGGATTAPAPAPPAATQPAAPTGDDPIAVMLGTLDMRLTVPVAVGSNGPYPFIIDTGAERSVIARELSGALRLAPGNPVRVVSVTGTRQVDTVLIRDLMIPAIGQRHDVVAPALAARDIGALGLLGIDTLANHRVEIDFAAGTMAVRPSERRARNDAPRDPDAIVVTAKSTHGQLIVTDAHYGSTRIRVMIDTGSQVTVGNTALLRRILRSKGVPTPVLVTTVTGDQLHAVSHLVPDIRLGPIAFGAMPIAFAETPPFARFGLGKGPALMLGMDALRSFRRVEIDFANRQIRFIVPEATTRPPRPARTAVADAGSPARAIP